MKLRRFHIDIYCPAWGRDSVIKFCESLNNKKLVYSRHALKKIKSFKLKDRKVVKEFINSLNMGNELYLDYLFEFYTNKENEVRKACFRFPMRDMKFDLILVISCYGKLVTIYSNYDLSGRRVLNELIYEKRETINEGKISIKN